MVSQPGLSEAEGNHERSVHTVCRSEKSLFRPKGEIFLISLAIAGDDNSMSGRRRNRLFIQEG